MLIALAIIVPLGGGLNVVLQKVQDRDGGSAPRPRVEHVISMPKSVLGGRLKLTKDLSDSPEAKVPGLKAGDKQYTGWYTNGKRSEAYLFSGFNSPSAREDVTAARVLDGAVNSSDAPSPPKRHRITPPGAEREVTCVVLRKKDAGQALTVPTCAWDDDGSAAMVVDNSPEATGTKPAAYDLKAFAKVVDGIREDVRKSA
ncbi:hypothetical protein [Streptomyces sp. NPDC048172]|uniref:hypothetical protein n=1 Tax=Streptomyces sp. NPDC048172 TaxID=3365505 RepID=UPI003722D133